MAYRRRADNGPPARHQPSADATEAVRPAGSNWRAIVVLLSYVMSPDSEGLFLGVGCSENTKTLQRAIVRRNTP
jgi:hypothetical protein